MSTEITITATYGDKKKQINLTLPTGGGGNGWWHIYIDRYFFGTLHKRDGVWVHNSNVPDEFTADDIELMGEAIDSEMEKLEK